MKHALLKGVALTAVALLAVGTITLAGDRAPRADRPAHWTHTLNSRGADVMDIAFDKPVMRRNDDPKNDQEKGTVVQSPGVRIRVLRHVCAGADNGLSLADVFGFAHVVPQCKELSLK